jgi:hypothetical protein
MIIPEVDHDHYNGRIEAIEFARQFHNLLRMHRDRFPYNCVLWDIDEQFPTDVIFEVSAENTNVNALLSISSGRYTDNGYRPHANTLLHISCRLNNYNGSFFEAGINTFEDILDVLRVLRQIVEDTRNNVNDLDYVRIPENLLNRRYISEELRQLNMNN